MFIVTEYAALITAVLNVTDIAIMVFYLWQSSYQPLSPADISCKQFVSGLGQAFVGPDLDPNA